MHFSEWFSSCKCKQPFRKRKLTAHRKNIKVKSIQVSVSYERNRSAQFANICTHCDVPVYTHTTLYICSAIRYVSHIMALPCSDIMAHSIITTLNRARNELGDMVYYHHVFTSIDKANHSCLQG